MSEKKKHGRRGGRQKGTPNKINKKIAKELFKEYYFSESQLNGSEESKTRFELLLMQLEKIAFTSKSDAIKLKAINIIMKALGVYDNKMIEINTDDKKISLNIGFKD